MKRHYPILIHKEDDSAYGVTIPDIPGCFTAGDTIEKAMANIQEAVECYYEGEKIEDLPVASKIDDLIKDESLFVEGGFWMLTEINLSFMCHETIRVNITVPKIKLARIDRYIKRKGYKSRSAFLVSAAESISNEDVNHA